ncbi:hypothetical protein DPEC_G00026420 [Dallia pectoralis]|uniref:Uncharacterized protein n=1 Tax=Dallia pectoralis TaxID=75939 RepID=A0ACC2HHN7_DALPE|nr:hypothetical protein DPEC_G00026420 [Dallia pectoralis]
MPLITVPRLKDAFIRAKRSDSSPINTDAIRQDGRKNEAACMYVKVPVTNLPSGERTKPESNTQRRQWGNATRRKDASETLGNYILVVLRIMTKAYLGQILFEGSEKSQDPPEPHQRDRIKKRLCGC